MEYLRRGEVSEVVVDDAVLAEIVEDKGDTTDSQVVLELYEDHHEEYFGPIPDPTALAQYENVMPGMADRLVTMEEEKAKNEIKLAEIRVTNEVATTAKLADADIANTEKLVDAEIFTGKRGQNQAYSLALIAFTASVVFFALGNPYAGTVLLSFPVVILISAFLNRRVIQPPDATALAKKFEKLDQPNQEALEQGKGDRPTP